jgi:hypothetical protein
MNQLSLIGISLSDCIRDILEGCMQESEVEKIISGTCAPTEEAWEELLADYSAIAWKRYPSEAVAIVRRFRADGKIQQPWLTSGLVPSKNYGVWVQREADIVWMDPTSNELCKWPEDRRLKAITLEHLIIKRYVDK